MKTNVSENLFEPIKQPKISENLFEPIKQPKISEDLSHLPMLQPPKVEDKSQNPRI